MSYLLFLDDQRRFTQIKYPDEIEAMCLEIVEVKNYNEFVDVIKSRGLPKVVSLDHDLGPQSYQEGERTRFTQFNYNNLSGEKTGYDAAKFLISYCEEHKQPLPKYYSQSMNPVGRKNILDLLNKYKESKKNNGKN